MQRGGCARTGPPIASADGSLQRRAVGIRRQRKPLNRLTICAKRGGLSAMADKGMRRRRATPLI